jgi:hypothetical protein
MITWVDLGLSRMMRNGVDFDLPEIETGFSRVAKDHVCQQS